MSMAFCIKKSYTTLTTWYIRRKKIETLLFFGMYVYTLQVCACVSSDAVISFKTLNVSIFRTLETIHNFFLRRTQHKTYVCTTQYKEDGKAAAATTEKRIRVPSMDEHLQYVVHRSISMWCILKTKTKTKEITKDDVDFNTCICGSVWYYVRYVCMLGVLEREYTKIHFQM